MRRWANYMKKRLLSASGKIAIVVLCIFTVIALKTFVIDYSHVSGYSMNPTLRDGQPLLVLKCAYGLRKPRNAYEIPILGSILYYVSDKTKVDSVLKQRKSFEYIHGSLPSRGDIVALNIPGNNHFHAVKRCVAIAGDSIPYPVDLLPYEIVPYKGMVIDARAINEKQRKYLMQNRDFRFDAVDSAFVALDNFVYVVGDNMDASEDSRRWGPMAMNQVFGRVIYR